MRLVPIKQVLAFSLALFTSISSNAEQEVRTSFRIQMPRSLAYGNSPLLKSAYNVNKNVNLKNFTIESKYPTWTEDIKMDIQFELSPLNIWNFSQPQSFETTSLNINVDIGKTVTEYTEVRQSPGSSITVDLKAECENIKLKLVDPQAQLSGLITVVNKGHQIKLNLNESKIKWNQNAWKVLPFQCKGVTGFEKMAEEEIKKYLKTPDSLQDKITTQIKNEIANLEEKINSSIFKKHKLQESAKNFLFSMEPQLLLPHKNNEDFKFDGVTRIRFRGLSLNKKESTPVYFENTVPPSPHQAGPTFIFPIKLVSPMVEKLFSNGNFFESWWSNELEGFSDFMNSESQRRYAWPEMLRYNSKSKFKFQAHMIKQPIVRDIKNSGERVEMKIQSTLVIQMYAPQNGGYVPYVEWTAPFDAHLSVQVYQGGLWYKILKDSQFNWSAKMNPLYIKKFRPKDTKIDAKRIGEAVIESVRKKQYRWAIPNWQVADGLKYRAEKMFRTETMLWIYWNPLKK